MKNDWRAQAVVVFLSAFAVAGCSSTQPDRIETRPASLSFKTTAFVGLWDCYEDPAPPGCFPQLEDNGSGLQKKETRSVPWRYSLEITVIRAGTTEEVVVTSLSGEVGSSVQAGDDVEHFVSLTDYDPNMPAVPDKVVDGTTYSNGHAVSTGSPIYLATINVDPSVPNPPNILLNTAQTFDFTLNAGDTVLVRARKQGVDDPSAPQFQPPLDDITLESSLSVSGVPVVNQKELKLVPDNSPGLSFSYTVR